MLAKFLCFSCCFHPKYGQEFRPSYNPFLSFCFPSLQSAADSHSLSSSLSQTTASISMLTNTVLFFFQLYAVFPTASVMTDFFASFLCCRVCPAIPSCRSVLAYLFTCLQTFPVRGSLSCRLFHSFSHHVLLFSQLNRFSQ